MENIPGLTIIFNGRTICDGNKELVQTDPLMPLDQAVLTNGKNKMHIVNIGAEDEYQETKALTVEQIARIVSDSIPYIDVGKDDEDYGRMHNEIVDAVSQAIYAALSHESDRIRILKNQMDMLLRTENAKMVIQANKIIAFESKISELENQLSWYVETEASLCPEDVGFDDMIVGLMEEKQALESQVKELEIEVMAEKRRLDYLINDSALDNSEGKSIQLIVTQNAVGFCAGTHHEKYHQDVRRAIDLAMGKI